jgi:DNA polymerase I-like protein with 3'-5' exonuclease and polymerase domains
MGHLTGVADDDLLKFNDRPLIQTLRSYRKGKKETGTYGEVWTQRWLTKPLAKEGWRHPGDGRLHCRFNQLEAETGRSSSEKPNAMNLPKDDDVRACFICDPPGEDGEENCIVTVDMAGAELRIIAELANATTWIKAFAKNQDVHSVSTEILYPEKWPSLALPDCAYYKKSTERKVLDRGYIIEIGDLLRVKCKCPEHNKLRDGTKATNFLLCYGGGPSALADELGVSLATAEELMRLHRSKFPDVWGYLEISGKRAAADREARDMYGRRRLFPEPTWETAKEWFIYNETEKLELREEDCERSIFSFRLKEGRNPNPKEKWSLTHRDPTDAEIKQAIGAMYSSIRRRGKNHCIQGTNASIIKRAMGSGFDKNGIGYLWHLLPAYNARIQNMVHDELVVHCPKKNGEIVAQIVGDAFRRAASEVMKNVIMLHDAHISDRWMK